MINTKLLRSKILIILTLGFSFFILYRCIGATVGGHFVPIDYWLYAVLGLSGCLLAIFKKNWARFCILCFYALQMFFVNFPYLKLYYHVGFYYSIHVSKVKADHSQVPLPGITLNLVGIVLFIFALFLLLSNEYSGSKAVYDWQCPECGNFNDGSLIKCKCGYEDEKV